MTDAIQCVLAMDDLSPTQRLVYLALRDTAPLTRDEIAAHVGVSTRTVDAAINTLADAEWATGRIRETPTRGQHPTEYNPLVPCPECGKRFVTEQGVATHCRQAHSSINATDLGALDPDDVGADPSAPAPEGRGLR